MLTELRTSVASNDFATRCVTIEQKDVECIGLVNKLLLRNLFLTPKFFSLGC